MSDSQHSFARGRRRGGYKRGLLTVSNVIRKLEKAVAVRNSLLERFPANSTLLENYSLILRQREMLSLQRFEHKWLLENWPRLRERCWIFSSETATAFMSSPDVRTSPESFTVRAETITELIIINSAKPQQRAGPVILQPSKLDWN